MLVRIFPLRSPDDTVISGVAPNTSEEVEMTMDDLMDALRDVPAAVKTLSDHIEKLLSEGVKLHPIEAVKQVPEAASAVAGEAGQAAGSTLQAAGHVAGAVPAAATDVLDTTGTAASAVAKPVRKFRLQKRRRS